MLIMISAYYNNVVTISGLGGHAFGSFKDRGKDYMWLRDELPYDLTSDERPFARVMTYGYDSKVVEITSV